MTSVLNLFQTALELGLISSLTVLALFLSYSMLNICDLSTDGCFTLGACVGSVVALSGHPLLAVPAAMFAGMLSGLITAILQTRMGIDSLLSGIAVNTALYSVNIAIMGGSSILNLNKAATIFTLSRDMTEGTVLKPFNRLIVIVLVVALVVIFLSLFLRTRFGLALRATGSNPDMVKSSSINTVMIITAGLCISNSFTALSGCLLAAMQKSANIDIGSGMLTVALASLLIGRTFIGKGKIPVRALGAVAGAFAFRLVYTVALRFNMPAFLLKLVSSVIVILAIFVPYMKERIPEMRRRAAHRSGKGEAPNA